MQTRPHDCRRSQSRLIPRTTTKRTRCGFWIGAQSVRARQPNRFR
jgi:hypothetical protein